MKLCFYNFPEAWHTAISTPEQPFRGILRFDGTFKDRVLENSFLKQGWHHSSGRMEFFTVDELKESNIRLRREIDSSKAAEERWQSCRALETADQALYEAQNSGRNCSIFSGMAV